MSDNERYTVGWICAISTEYVAARAFLDKEHGKPAYVSKHDGNAYTLGEIAGHNVVIAVLPDGEYGLASAAVVATNMLNSFPNIRVGVMVGIAGGVPTNHDVRLGDVVVSAPRDGDRGVFQYDYGKAIQNQEFKYTGLMNQPPQALRAAVAALKADYVLHGQSLERRIRKVLEDRPTLQEGYGRPQPSRDQLFKSEVTHESACAGNCIDDQSKLMQRPDRKAGGVNPAIHYGLIASGNQLMKDALTRDRLAADKDVLCFEMEAAGLMNNFPCLVVRGICDYSDSHKNDEWQGYAALAAAAYTKDLLGQVQSFHVEREERINSILVGLPEVLQQQGIIAEELLQTEKEFAMERLSQEQQRVHQLFRLTASSRDATYEWYKDRVEERVEGTCMWLLDHENYNKWLEESSGPLLVSADPGCGKSVLAKYLVDHALPRSAIVCYFFFKVGDQNTVRQALCAVLHQLFSQEPRLIEHAMKGYRANGKELINSTKSLWHILNDATGDPQAGSVIVVLDALDECADTEFRDLVQNVKSQFGGGRVADSRLKYLLTCRPYEEIVSQFQSLLHAFPYIRIPGEEESDAISQEVNRVIRYRVKRLSQRLPPEAVTYLEERLQEGTHRTYLWVYLVFDYLETQNFKRTTKAIKAAILQLPNSVNEAYEQILSKAEHDPMVEKALSIILTASRPLSVSEMNVAVNVQGTMGSLRDLDLEREEQFKSRLRSQCGLFISIHHDKLYFLHQTAREFLIDKKSSGRAAVRNTEPRWQNSITIQQAHFAFAELCILYLRLLSTSEKNNPDSCSLTPLCKETNQVTNDRALIEYSACFWSYHFRHADIDAGATIVRYATEICDRNSDANSLWFEVYESFKPRGMPSPFTGLLMASYFGFTGVVKTLLDNGADVNEKDLRYERTPLSHAIIEGHEDVVKIILSNKDVDLNAKDDIDFTPIGHALLWDHKSIAKLLLVDGNFDVNYSCLCFGTFDFTDLDIWGTPLCISIICDHEDIGQLLLAKPGIDITAEAVLEDNDSVRRGEGSPLFFAAVMGHKDIVRMILARNDVDVNCRGYSDPSAMDTESCSGTPLFVAAATGGETIVRWLLDKDEVDINAAGSAAEEKLSSPDDDHTTVCHGTPLSIAALKGHSQIVEMLLRNANVDVNARCYIRYQSFSRNIQTFDEDEDEFTELTFRNARPHCTPVFLAAIRGHDEIVKMLLTKKGLDLDTEFCIVDECGDWGDGWLSYQGTLLPFAAWCGNTEIVESILTKDGVNVNAQVYVEYELESPHCSFEKYNYSQATALCLAAAEKREDVVRLLLGDGRAEIDAKDENGRTPLMWAVFKNAHVTVDTLIKHHADVNAKDRSGCGPLFIAIMTGNAEIAGLLLKTGSNVHAKNNSGRTPLMYATQLGNKEMVDLLLEYGAEEEVVGNSGCTPLAIPPRDVDEEMIDILN